MTGPIPSHRSLPRGRRAIVLLVVLGLSGMVPTAWTSAFGSVAGHRFPLTDSRGDAKLLDAERSLLAGQGPAKGVVATCQASGVGSISCGPAADSHPSSAQVGNWYNVTPRFHPMPTVRFFDTMVDDLADGYVLLFGGFNGTFVFGDTWKYSGGAWTQLFPSASPPARAQPGLAYDSADGYVVLFGGLNTTLAFSDTWKFSGGEWTELAPATSPAARYATTLVYDPADRYVVLFGGLNGTSVALNDTWEFTGGSWTQLAPTTVPAARGYAATAFDAADGYVVMFGGLNLSTVAISDTWRFVAGQWTQITSSPFPSPRAAALFVWDPAIHAVLLYGGTNLSFEPTDTWTFAGGAWTHLSPLANPSTVLAGGWCWDSHSGFVMLFGGSRHNTAGGIVQGGWIFVTPLAVNASASRASVDVGQSVTASAAVTGGAAPYSYQWNFSDGGLSNLSAPGHAYGASGSYAVNVTVIDWVGQIGRASTTVTVAVRPTLSVGASKVNPTAGDSATFTATVSGGQAPLQVTWSFGDGTAATGNPATHPFNRSGTFSVNATVTDAAGVSANATLQVRVAPAPTSASPWGGSIGLLAAGLVLVIAVVALGAYLLLRRRRAPPGPAAVWAAPPPPPGATPPPGAGGPPGGSPPPGG